MKLHLADHLTLPIDAATQTFACIGRKGSGKTYAAGKLVELLIGAGVQVGMLDIVAGDGADLTAGRGDTRSTRPALSSPPAGPAAPGHSGDSTR